jgi:dihydrofolate reductase
VPQDDGGTDDFAAFFDGTGAFAMGATTYEWILAHDELVGHPDRWRAWYGDVPACVFTHRDLPTIAGIDIRFVQGDVVPVHAQMRVAAGGKDIWLLGGGELVGTFADAGLLDEIHLGVQPVLLGAGVPLLPRRLTSRDLTLRSVDRNGQAVNLVYTVTHGSGRPWSLGSHDAPVT